MMQRLHYELTEASSIYFYLSMSSVPSSSSMP